MSTLQFHLLLHDRKGGVGFYTPQDVPSERAPFLYYLLAEEPNNSPGVPASLSFEEAWKQYIGCFLFSTEELKIKTSDDVSRLAQCFNVSSREKNLRMIAWVYNGELPHMDFVAARAIIGSNYQAIIGRSDQPLISFGNVHLRLAAGTRLIPNYTAGQIDFSGPGTTISLQRMNTSKVMFESVTLSLNPSVGAAGSLSARVTWNVQDFLQLFRDNFYDRGVAWGGEIRYFYPDGTKDKQLVYPLFIPSTNPNEKYAFRIALHPLYPTDPQYSSFIFLPDQIPRNMASKFARDTSGKPVGFSPVEQVGFYLGRRPQVDSEPNASSYVYLAPLGRYRINAGDASPLNLMCGVSGLEYLQLADGDILEFVGNRPAYAGKDLSESKRKSSGDSTLLSSLYSTSWVRMAGHESSPKSVAGKRSYFAQPNRMTNYAKRVLDTHYNAAVASLIREWPSVERDTSAKAFPLALYGGVFPVSGTSVANWPNKDTDGSAFQQFEHRVLTMTRYQQLKGDEVRPPVFQNRTGDALSGRTVSPQGFLVQLNDDLTGKGLKADGAAEPAPSPGTWNQLILAKNNGQYFSFNKDAKTGVVDADLAHALMNNQVFLVLNNWPRFTAMESDLSLGGFRFMLRPPEGDANPGRTILIFKYNHSKSLQELINTPGDWADPLVMLENSDVAFAQTVFRDAMNKANSAKGKPHDPFGYFRDVVASDASWTGIIALNAPTTGTVPELEMLFAGIDGELTAHHFGVEINQINNDGAKSQPEIDRSSLFGVIYKPPPQDDSLNLADDTEGQPPPYQFIVRELIVGIKNSSVTQFNATVGMVINQLFGRDVLIVDQAPSISKPDTAIANMLTIHGQYQRQGDVGSVSFVMKETDPPYFTFKTQEDAVENMIRVLDKFYVRGASLVPVEAEGNSTKVSAGATKTIRSRFSLNGDLIFEKFPFYQTQTPGIDLFSYGVTTPGGAEKGLGINDLAFGISFELDANGKRVGPTKIDPAFNNITVADDKQGIRGGSLLKGLPLKLSGFLQNDDGITSAQIGASPMHMQQIQDYVTTTPQYALRFELPLGSLGDLSGVHAGIEAFLVLAWGPSMASPDNDGAAIYVQMPQLSAGYKGFDLQGILKTTFGDANMMAVEMEDQGVVYVMLFNHVALSFFGIEFPPGIIADFILFTNASDGTGNDTNIAWNLAATQASGSGSSPCDES